MRTAPATCESAYLAGAPGRRASGALRDCGRTRDSGTSYATYRANSPRTPPIGLAWRVAYGVPNPHQSLDARASGLARMAWMSCRGGKPNRPVFAAELRRNREGTPLGSAREWRAWQESNLRPRASEARALSS